MVARIIPFRKRLLGASSAATDETTPLFDLKSLPEFASESFERTARSICADNSAHKIKSESDIVTDMFQLDLLVMLPGQELPIHLNTPYFWGADRTTLPQWLLVAMKNSRLFDHLFIPQVQGLVPLRLEQPQQLNKLADRTQGGFVEINGEGGDFFFYPYKSVKSSKTGDNSFYVFIL